MSPQEGTITHALAAVSEGKATPGEQLLPLIYEELKGIAHGRLARSPAQTLQTTDLVHECWLRIAAGGIDFESRRHFFGAAANAMRNVLVDQARRRSSLKRESARKVELPASGLLLTTTPPIEDVLNFNDALEQLGQEHERAAQVVSLHFFAGLSMPEIAEVIESSLSTVERDWRFARSWLQSKLDQPRS